MTTADDIARAFQTVTGRPLELAPRDRRSTLEADRDERRISRAEHRRDEEERYGAR